MTLNEIVGTITDLGDKHQIIETTHFGPAMDKLAEAEVKYPMFTFDTNGGNIDGATLVLTFSMFFFDRLTADRSNMTDVQSDMLQVAQDIVAQLRWPGWEFDIRQGVQVSLFIDSTPEMLAGVNAQVTLVLPYISDRCAVPSTQTY